MGIDLNVAMVVGYNLTTYQFVEFGDSKWNIHRHHNDAGNNAVTNVFGIIKYFLIQWNNL